MAVQALVDKTPDEKSIGTTYQEYSYGDGLRNVIVYCDGDVYYHPDGVGLDGTAVSATERQRLGAGTHSLRLPGSGCGWQDTGGGDGSATHAIAFAAVTGTVVFGITAFHENVSR